MNFLNSAWTSTDFIFDIETEMGKKNRQGESATRTLHGIDRPCEGGADYVVVGRPIRDTLDPISVIETMQEEIAACL